MLRSRSLLALTLCLAAHVEAIRNWKQPALQQKEHIWSHKNGDLMRTGKSVLHTAPSDLTTPLWKWSVPGHTLTSGSIESTPLIDRDGNIYITTTMGGIHKMARNGAELWSVRVGSRLMTGALYGDAMYIGTCEGEALSIDLATGRVNWRQKYAPMAGGDAWTVSAANGTALFVGATRDMTGGWGGNGLIVALSTTDGSFKWVFDSDGKVIYNFMPVVADNAVTFIDYQGSMHRLDFATGEEQWVTGGSPDGSTTAGVVLGPGGMAYTNFNTHGMSGGVLVAYDVNTGKEKWRREVGAEASAAPVVGQLGSNGRIGVVVGLGTNAGGFSRETKDAHAWLRAFDAETGADMWTFETPHQMIHGSHGPLGAVPGEDTVPDTWSTAAIGSDGVVYAGWQGGRQFAVNGTTGRMISSHFNGYGDQAEPAIGDGLVVFATCGEVIAFGEA